MPRDRDPPRSGCRRPDLARVEAASARHVTRQAPRPRSVRCSHARRLSEPNGILEHDLHVSPQLAQHARFGSPAHDPLPNRKGVPGAFRRCFGGRWPVRNGEDMSFPRKAILRSDLISRMIASASVVLPDPLSPTNAKRFTLPDRLCWPRLTAFTWPTCHTAQKSRAGSETRPAGRRFRQRFPRRPGRALATRRTRQPAAF